jgi:hypothetical protein
MYAKGRDLSSKYQSPEQPSRQRRAHEKQLEGLQLDPTEDKYLINLLYPNSADKDQIHHRVFLETIAPLYRGLGEDEARQLTHEIESLTGRRIGNNIGNLMPVPQAAHQGVAHKYALNNGLQYHDDESAKGIIKDIVEAGSVPSIKYRAHVGSDYINKYLPELDNALNDGLTDYYKMREAPFRKAGDIFTATDGSTQNIVQNVMGNVGSVG